MEGRSWILSLQNIWKNKWQLSGMHYRFGLSRSGRTYGGSSSTCLLDLDELLSLCITDVDIKLTTFTSSCRIFNFFQCRFWRAKRVHYTRETFETIQQALKKDCTSRTQIYKVISFTSDSLWPSMPKVPGSPFTSTDETSHRPVRGNHRR